LTRAVQWTLAFLVVAVNVAAYALLIRARQVKR